MDKEQKDIILQENHKTEKKTFTKKKDLYLSDQC